MKYCIFENIPNSKREDRMYIFASDIRDLQCLFLYMAKKYPKMIRNVLCIFGQSNAGCLDMLICKTLAIHFSHFFPAEVAYLEQ